MLHVIMGPDHVAAVLPFVIEAKRKAWKIGLFWGIGQPMFGALAEKYGDRKAIVAGIFCYALGLFLSAFAITPGQHQLLEMVIGFGIGPEALGGMLGGALITCVLLALTMANAGGAWDNAKKHVEKGNLGGKGSEVHKAVVVGDTVGDPFKDTSGPAMNILINVMAIVSLVIAPLLV